MKPATPVADLLTQLSAARGEVAEAAARSRALRRQMQAEGLAQAARLASQAGENAQAAALADEAGTARRRALDVKA